MTGVDIKQKVQEVVAGIYHRDGEVKPTTLIAEAKPKDSPIHAAFEWDNKKAGHEYRLIQARSWLRRVEIIIEDRPERFVHIPRIVVDGGADDGRRLKEEGYYKPISIVSKDRWEYDAAMTAAIANLRGAQNAYNDLKEAVSHCEEVPEINFDMADKGFEMVETALVM